MIKNVIDKIDNLELVDKNDFLDLAYYYSLKGNFLDYLKDIVFSDKYEYPGCYNHDNNIIYYNMDHLKHFVESSLARIDKRHHLTEEEKIYYMNFMYLYSLFHELKHAEQESILKKRSKNTNPYEIILLYFDQLFRKTIYTDDKHDLFPTEINAECNGYRNACLLLNQASISPHLKNILISKTMNSSLRKYRSIGYKIVSPIELLVGDKEVYKSFKKGFSDSHFTLDEKVSYGLPLTIFQYTSCCLQKEKAKMNIKR